MRSLTATLTYGDVTKTVRLDKDKTDEVVEWPSTVVGDKVIEPVATRFEVSLNPAEAGERPNRLQSGSEDVLGETAELQPRELFSLEDIPILTRANFPFDRYPQVDVNLRYDDPANGIRQNDVVRLDKDTPSSTWRRFLVGAPAAPIMAKITYRAVRSPRPQLPLRAPDRPARRRRRPVPASRCGSTSWPPSTSTRSSGPSSISPTTIRANGMRDRGLHRDRRRTRRCGRSSSIGSIRTSIGCATRSPILMKDSTLFEGPWSTTLGAESSFGLT